MALENEQELQRAMAELTKSMQGLGTDTANADNELTKFAKSASQVGTAMAGAAGQVMAGGGAFKSLNGAIDLATKALGSIVGAIPVIGGAAKEFANGVGEAAKYVMGQLDALAKNYNELGDAGALAADGLDGVQRQFRQMGLVSLPTFTKALGQNSQGMIALGGSMSGAAEQFSKISGALTTGDMAGQFARLGMSFDQVGESAGKYVGALGRYGMTQGRTFEQLAQSTANYIQEVDLIARVTGASRKQQEDEQQKSLIDVRFRAKIADMIDKGQVEEANRLQTYVNGLTGAAADAARATATGIPMTQEAAQANMMSRDAIRQNISAVIAGKDATRAVVDTQKGLAEGAKTFRTQLMYGGETFGNVAIQALDAEAIVKRRAELEAKGIDPVEAAKQAQAELLASKGATGQFADAQVKVAGASKDLQNLSFNLVKNVVPAVDAFAGSIKRVTSFIDEKFGGAPAKPGAQEEPGWLNKTLGGWFGGGAPGAPAPAPTKPGEKKETAAAPPGSSKEFLDQMYNNLLTEAKKQGLKNPEVIAKLGTAQSALETGYGKHTAGSQNYFGIKAKPGDPGSGGVATKEFINGKWVTINDKFRKYGSMQESAADYVKFLSENKRYKGVLGAGNIQEAIAEQGKTGYATDPAYAQKLAGIISKIPGGESVAAGPRQPYKTAVADVNPSKTLTTPAQQTQQTADATQTEDKNAAMNAALLDKLDLLTRVNQQQLSVQQRQLKQSA